MTGPDQQVFIVTESEVAGAGVLEKGPHYVCMAVLVTESAKDKILKGSGIWDLSPDSYCNLHSVRSGDVEQSPDGIPRLGAVVSEQVLNSMDGVIDALKRAFREPNNRVHKLGYSRPDCVYRFKEGRKLPAIRISWDD